MKVDALGVVGGVTGAVCVALADPLHANMIWVMSNPVLAVYNHRAGEKRQALLFAVFTVLAGYGVVTQGGLLG